MPTRGTNRGWLPIVGGVALTLPALPVLFMVVVFAIFVLGWFVLLLPVPVAVLALVALWRSEPSADAMAARTTTWCPTCGGVLSRALVEAVLMDDGELRERSVYRCEELEHRSWRWNEPGEPLRTTALPSLAGDNPHRHQPEATR